MEPTKKLCDGAVSTTVEEIASRSHDQSLSNGSTRNENSNTFKHPLLNPLVLDLIIKHLDPDFEQLKTLRLVSKVWTKVTLHHWRNSCGVLTLVPDNPSCFTKSKYKKGLPVSQFFSEFQDPQSPFQLSQKPFSKYKLTEFVLDFEVCSEPNGPEFQFWNAIGPLMKSVHFYKCTFPRPGRNSGTSCPSVQFLVGMIPNLKDVLITDKTGQKMLKIYDDKSTDADELSDSDDDDEYDDEEPHLNLRTLTVCGDLRQNQGLTELLASAPGLEVITGNDQRWRALLQPIHALRYDSGSVPQALSNLKEIDLINSLPLNSLHIPWDPTDAPILPKVGTQIPLKTLSLHLAFDDTDNSEENLDIYLNSFSNTLKTFKCLRAPAGGPYKNFLVNTSMTALTELYLWGIIASHLGFLKSTPHLKTLKIDLACFDKMERVQDIIWDLDYHNNWCYQKYQEDMVGKVPKELGQGILCPELEYLEIDQEFPEKSLRILGKWVPNLKTLKTILNGGTIPVVCEIWRDLTELVCLHGSKIGNSCLIRDEEKAGFSGGPPSKLKICDLKDLERLQLDAYCDECELTDDAVFKGFLKMPGLKYLDVCIDSKTSVEAEEALKKGIQFCKVSRTDRDKCCGSYKMTDDYSRCNRCTFRYEVIFMEDVNMIFRGLEDGANRYFGINQERDKNVEDSAVEDVSSGSSGCATV